MTIVALAACACRRADFNIVHVSEAYPFFHHLEVFGDRFSAVSPDFKTLRGLTFDGSEIWRRPMAEDTLIGRYDDHHLYIQERHVLFLVAATDGKTEKLFDLPDHQRFVKDDKNGVVYLVDQRFDRNTFQLLDRGSEPARFLRER